MRNLGLGRAVRVVAREVVARDGMRRHILRLRAAAEAAEAAAKAGAADYAIGAAAGLVGSMSYALMYVLTEKTQKAADAPPPEALCVFVGMVGTAVLVAYIAVWDGPSWCGSDGNHHAALTLGVIFSHGTKPPMINCQDRLGTNVTGEI